MTTFQKILVRSELEGNEPLSDYALGYLNERVRNSVYDYILRRFHEEAEKCGLTKAQLARRIKLGPDRVSKLLGSPGNWTLETITELLVGICREELIPHSEPYLHRSTSNYRVEDIFEYFPSCENAVERHDETQGRRFPPICLSACEEAERLKSDAGFHKKSDKAKGSET